MSTKTHKAAHYDDSLYYTTGLGRIHNAKGLLGTVTGKWPLKIAILLDRVPDFPNFGNYPTFNDMTTEEITKVESIATKTIKKIRGGYLVITRYEFEPGSSLWVSHV